MITEKNYKELADDVYKVDSGKEKNPIKEGNLVGGDKYQVLKVEDNTANGMQAMVVVQVDRNKTVII